MVKVPMEIVATHLHHPKHMQASLKRHCHEKTLIQIAVHDMCHLHQQNWHVHMTITDKRHTLELSDWTQQLWYKK